VPQKILAENRELILDRSGRKLKDEIVYRFINDLVLNIKFEKKNKNLFLN